MWGSFILLYCRYIENIPLYCEPLSTEYTDGAVTIYPHINEAIELIVVI